MKFHPGQLLATPGALRAIEESGQRPGDFLARHLAGDWGEVCPEDWRLNDQAVEEGGRVLSAYSTLRGVKVWLITEAAGDDGHRTATTLLLPAEY
jgi:hypothetical protein